MCLSAFVRPSVRSAHVWSENVVVRETHGKELFYIKYNTSASGGAWASRRKSRVNEISLAVKRKIQSRGKLFCFTRVKRFSLSPCLSLSLVRLVGTRHNVHARSIRVTSQHNVGGPRRPRSPEKRRDFYTKTSYYYYASHERARALAKRARRSALCGPHVIYRCRDAAEGVVTQYDDIIFYNINKYLYICRRTSFRGKKFHQTPHVFALSDVRPTYTNEES